MTADILNPRWPAPANIAGFSYSKLSHFKLFGGLPFQSYNVGDPNPAICDLKVYQDQLIYCFIRRNVAPGPRILEVGGGDSRILKHFSSNYECWNADKCEGLVNGLIPYIYANASLQTRFAPLAEIEANPDTYAMSQQAYEANWQPLTKDPYEIFGRAFSINLL